MADKGELVDQIKTLQRTDPGFKQVWWDHCDKHLGGSKDPNRHDESVLEEFLNNYNLGNYEAPRAPPPQRYQAPPQRYQAPPQRYQAPAPRTRAPPPMAAAASAAPVSLADMVKAGQRKSTSWKSAWQAYCSLYANSRNDPSRHDENFIMSFIDYAGQLAEQSLAEIAQDEGLLGGPAPTVGNKRASAFAADYPPAKRQATPAGMNPQKKALVDKIKALQRSSPDTKEAWWAYCDTEQQGIKDPSRHEIESLETFLAAYE